jgi:selenophosphate synthase
MNLNNIAKELSDLVISKNKRYGNAYLKVSQILRILFPDGIGEDYYDDVTVIIRILDKICRLSSNPTNEDRINAFTDISGYGLLMVEKYSSKGTK